MTHLFICTGVLTEKTTTV